MRRGDQTSRRRGVVVNGGRRGSHHLISFFSQSKSAGMKRAMGQGDREVDGSGSGGVEDDVNFAGVDPVSDAKFESEESHMMKGFGMGGADEDANPEPN